MHKIGVFLYGVLAYASPCATFLLPEEEQEGEARGEDVAQPVATNVARTGVA
jgi:hypothetical protein